MKYVFHMQFRRGAAMRLSFQMIFRFSRFPQFAIVYWSFPRCARESNFSSDLKQFKGIFIVGNDFLSRPLVVILRKQFGVRPSFSQRRDGQQSQGIVRSLFASYSYLPLFSAPCARLPWLFPPAPHGYPLPLLMAIERLLAS